MSGELLQHERQDGVDIIRLARPPVNAFRYDDWRALRDLLPILDADPESRVIVFTGAPGEHFSAGHDLQEFRALSAAEILTGVRLVHEVLSAIRATHVPMIAALHGAVMGSALLLACACDVRLAAVGARLALPEIQIGAIGGYRELHAVLPRGEARWLTWTGEAMFAQRAQELGLVQELAEDQDAVVQRALSAGRHIAGLIDGPLKKIMRPLLQDLESVDIATGNTLEGAALQRLFDSRANGS
jgi:enoyl-CoA hydratase